MVDGPWKDVVGALVGELAVAAAVAQVDEVDDAVGEAVVGVRALHDEQLAAVDEQAVAARERAAVDLELADLARGVAVLAHLDAEEPPGVRVDDDELVGAPIAVVAVTVAVVAALVVAAVVVDHDAVEVERRRRGVEGDLGRRRDDVGGVDRLGRRRAGGDLLRRQVVDRGALGVGRVDVAALGDVEVVDEGRRAVAALGVERRQQRAAVDVVDLDRPRARAGRVELAVLDLQAGGRLARGAGDEDGHRRRGVAQLAAVDAAVAGGRDEEEAAALVEGHALGVAVLRLGQRVDVRGAVVVDLAGRRCRRGRRPPRAWRRDRRRRRGARCRRRPVVLAAVLLAAAAAAAAPAARAVVGEGHRSAAGQCRHGEDGHDHPQDLSHVNAPS